MNRSELILLYNLIKECQASIDNKCTSQDILNAIAEYLWLKQEELI